MIRGKYVFAVMLTFALPVSSWADDGAAGAAYYALEHCLDQNVDWPENCQNVPYLSCIGALWVNEPDANKKREICWTVEMEAWQRLSEQLSHRLEMNLPIEVFEAFQQAQADRDARLSASAPFLDRVLDKDDPLVKSYLARTDAIEVRNESLRLLDYRIYHQDGLLELYVEGDK